MFSTRSLIAASVFVVASLALAGCSSSDTPTSDDTGSKSSKDSSSSSKDKSGSSKEGTDPSDTTDSTDPTSPKETPSTSTKKKADGAQCKESADCESDFCVFKSGGSLGMCTKTCDDNIDCDLGSKCVKLGDAPQKACVPE